MATKKSQRIGIWIIAIALVAGTLGSFLIMILAPKNQAVEQARIEQFEKEYSEAYEVYQEKVNAENARIATELSEQYFDEFYQYVDRVGEFDAASVEELGTEDLKQGDGEELTNESTFTAYYIGWNPSGTIFDQSIADDALRMPIEAYPGGVITGWTEGVAGMKVGGVRELTIPSDQAYGDQAQGDDIPANTPLKFIVMVIPTPDTSALDTIEEPEMPKELRDYYRRTYGMEF